MDNRPKNRKKEKRSLASDLAGPPTGTIGGISKEAYDAKYSGFSGALKSMGTSYKEHVVDRAGIKTSNISGRNNPRGARGAR